MLIFIELHQTLIQLARTKMSVKYEVCIVESERGWGQNREYEYYDTMQEAEERRDTINLSNEPKQEIAPDWYMYAEKKIRKVRH